MVEKVREFLRTGAGKGAAIGLIILALVVVVLSFRSNFGETEAGALSRERLFICSETGKTFTAEMKPGMRTPIPSPFSGKNTGFEAEMCYWTKDGKLKKDPTPVLLNHNAGKPEPTFCPDCGRLVVTQNPPGLPTDPPPPTKAEYKPRPPER